MNFDHKGIISRLVDGVVFDPGNQGPVPPRGQNMAKKDEIKEFVSDLRISEPTRRIQGKNLYLFWYPEPQSCRRQRLILNLSPPPPNLKALGESLSNEISDNPHKISGLFSRNLTA